MRYTLVHLPSVVLKVDGVYTNHAYRRVMPPSLCRVAQFLRESAWAQTNNVELAGIVDIRTAAPDLHTPYREFTWEGMAVQCERVGGPFELADQAIRESDVIGLTAHFTMERNITADFVKHAKRVKPGIRIWVGGADATAEPDAYRAMGAEVQEGDLDTLPNLTRPAFDLLGDLGKYTEGHDGPLPRGVLGPVAPLIFTRGCTRECDFCETRRSRYNTLSLESAKQMLRHYRSHGIQAIDVLDDNLLLQTGSAEGRQTVIDLFRHMAAEGWSWNFPNGLEIGLLIKKGELDTELLSTIFWNRWDGERRRGCFRLYVPVETWKNRARYKKLRTTNEQIEIIRAIAKEGFAHMSFGTVMFLDTTLESYQFVKEGYEEIKDVVNVASGGNTAVRFGVFNIIPIAQYRGLPVAYREHELWNFYTPSCHGQHLSARQFFEESQRIVRELTPMGYATLVNGTYTYE